MGWKVGEKEGDMVEACEGRVGWKVENWMVRTCMRSGRIRV